MFYSRRYEGNALGNIFLTRWQELNLRPFRYERTALPLSYTAIIGTLRRIRTVNIDAHSLHESELNRRTNAPSGVSFGRECGIRTRVYCLWGDRP